MPQDLPDLAPLRFSTRELSARDRIPKWREEFGRNMLHVEIEPLSKDSFSIEATLHSIAGVRMISCRNSHIRLTRTPANIADGDDSIGMIVNATPGWSISQRRQNLTMASGGAISLLHAEPASVSYQSGSYCALVLPREALARRAAGIDDATMRPIPRRTEALRLLVSYLRIVRDKVAPSTHELRNSVASHICDLAALALTAPADLGESSLSAVRHARLRLALDEIEARFQEPDLDVASIARRVGISPRYLQRLFETTGTTITERVNELRLQRAFALLTAAGDGRRISDIALEVGFSDLSHFNRLFRARFGDTPRGVRRGTAK